jgi:hypothetical protein
MGTKAAQMPSVTTRHMLGALKNHNMDQASKNTMLRVQKHQEYILRALGNH